MDQLQAVRSGKWKLYLALDEKRISPVRTVENTPAQCFDLIGDLSETTNVVNRTPEATQSMPPVMPPSSAGLNRTRVLGRNQ